MTEEDAQKDWPKQDMESGTLTALAHLYRAEVFRSTHWRTRLDNTTNWAVVTTGLALSLTFSTPEALSLPLILAARERFPRITLNITEAMSGFVGDWLSEGKIDLAVLYSRSKDARIRSELLLEEELVVLWPADAERPLEMSMEALDKVPMVLPSGAHGLRVLIDRTFQALGFAPEIAMEIDSFNNIKRLVAAGFGPSILPLYAVTEEVAAGSLRVSRIAAPGLWRGAHLMSPGGRPVTRALEAVHALLREVILDLRDKGAWAASRPPQVSGTAQVS